MGRKTDYYIRLNLLLAYVNCNKFTDRKKDKFYLMSLGEILLRGGYIMRNCLALRASWVIEKYLFFIRF